MILLNFSHPLTAEHLAQVEARTGQPVTRIIEAAVQIDPAQPLAAQVVAIVEQVGLTAQEWQTEALLVNPPGYAPATAALLAELHGRMGYFPAMLWIQPMPESTPPRFRVAEIVNLQAIRESARTRRTDATAP